MWHSLILIILLLAAPLQAATARFNIVGWSELSDSQWSTLQSEAESVIFCKDESGIPCEGCGFTIEHTPGPSTVWIKTCNAIMDQIKLDPRFSWIEDVAEAEPQSVFEQGSEDPNNN